MQVVCFGMKASGKGTVSHYIHFSHKSFHTNIEVQFMKIHVILVLTKLGEFIGLVILLWVCCLIRAGNSIGLIPFSIYLWAINEMIFMKIFKLLHHTEESQVYNSVKKLIKANRKTTTYCHWGNSLQPWSGLLWPFDNRCFHFKVSCKLQKNHRGMCADAFSLIINFVFSPLNLIVCLI